MNSIDNRQLGRKAFEAICIRAVQQVEAGESPEDVIRTLGFSRPRIYDSDGALELYYLPSYSPQLNPSEHVWAQVKHHSLGKRFISGPNQLRHLVHPLVRSIQKTPTLVRSFFRAPSTQYAALTQ